MVYHRVLAPQKCCPDSAMIGDNYDVCFTKIGQVVPELCTREVSFNKNSIVNVWG